MTGSLIYATYADGRFERNLRANARFARILGGARQTVLLTRRDLVASAIYPPHRDIFDAPRGAGYWAWKPWTILQAMDRAGADDVIFYQDCGFGLRYKTLLPLALLTRTARERGFIAGVRCPQYGANRRWNTRRCMDIMGCTDPRFETAATVQATWSMWTTAPKARTFVEEWLHYCLILDAVRDARDDERAGESPEFIEHRHDQAILTNLSIQRDAPVIDCLPETLDFAKSASMVELDLRARNGRGAALLLTLIVRAARWRRRAFRN